jgi:carboxymethylenebutenolidase
MADQLAQKLECDVWVPDYFAGRPIIPASKMQLPDRAGIKTSLWSYVKLVFIILPRIPTLISNRPSVVDARLASVNHHHFSH